MLSNEVFYYRDKEGCTMNDLLEKFERVYPGHERLHFYLLAIPTLDTQNHHRFVSTYSG